MIRTFLHAAESRCGLSKRILVGGGVSAAVVLLGTAIALAGGFPPPPASQSPNTSQAPAIKEVCGRGTAEALGRRMQPAHHGSLPGQVDPDSCAPNKNLVAASYGLICDPPADSGFNSVEKPQISVYGYATADAMNAAFDDLVKEYGAAERTLENPPGWQDWGAGTPRSRVGSWVPRRTGELSRSGMTRSRSRSTAPSPKARMCRGCRVVDRSGRRDRAVVHSSARSVLARNDELCLETEC